MRWLLALLLMITPALANHAPIVIGETSDREWYACHDKESALQVLDTARKATLAESFKIWGLLVDGKKCVLEFKNLTILEILDRGVPGDGMPEGYGEDLNVLRAVDSSGKEWFLINGDMVDVGSPT